MQHYGIAYPGLNDPGDLIAAELNQLIPFSALPSTLVVSPDGFSAERWTGVLALLNDPAYFAQVAVDAEAGTIVWPDGIDLAPEPLFEQAQAHPLLAA